MSLELDEQKSLRSRRQTALTPKAVTAGGLGTIKREQVAYQRRATLGGDAPKTAEDDRDVSLETVASRAERRPIYEISYATTGLSSSEYLGEFNSFVSDSRALPASPSQLAGAQVGL